MPRNFGLRPRPFRTVPGHAIDLAYLLALLLMLAASAVLPLAFAVGMFG